MTIRNKLETLLDPKRSRMMPPPGLQLYLRPRVTLTFDLLTLKVDTLAVSCPCPVDHLCQLESKSVYLFSKYQTNERTDGEVENIMSPPGSQRGRFRENTTTTTAAAAAAATTTTTTTTTTTIEPVQLRL